METGVKKQLEILPPQKGSKALREENIMVDILQNIWGLIVCMGTRLVLLVLIIIPAKAIADKYERNKEEHLLQEGDGRNGWKWFGRDRNVRIAYPYQILDTSADYISRITHRNDTPQPEREIFFHGWGQNHFKKGEWHKAHLTVEVVKPSYSLCEFELRGNTLIGVIPHREVGHDCQWRVWLDKDYKVDMNDIDTRWIPIEDPTFLDIIFPKS